MSDFGDDYSDYGDDWFYVEDEYMAADDLAEHAVASPPPTQYGDEDMLPDWDRFDYFNDIEYASDGYDDATFQPHNAQDSKIGQKRKRQVTKGRSKKRRRTAASDDQGDYSHMVVQSPIVWRSQASREQEPKLLDENAQSYALMKDWREKLTDTPRWARGSPPAKPKKTMVEHHETDGPYSEATVLSPSSEQLDDATATDAHDPEDEGSENGIEVGQDALMNALQRQLASAGGPLSGMDPHQLLQFAMRMMNDKDAGDDIAGEMADAMLEGDDEEDDAKAEENLLSWVKQQRSANEGDETGGPKSPSTVQNTARPPTPPSSEANRSILASGKAGDARSKTWGTKESKSVPSLKRKAADDEAEGKDSSQTIKKRATRSFQAPTTSSQAKAAPTRNTRSSKAKR